MKDIKELEGLDIVLGYSCNVNCYFCFQKDIRYTKKGLSRTQVINILDEGYNIGKRYVIFSGGEPTLDKNLEYYISYAKKIGYLVVRVHTNGNKFDNYEYLYSLYSSGLDGITISIHGFGFIHDKNTGVIGSFKVINNALKNFVRLNKINKNFIFDINTVITKYNYKYLLKYFLYIIKFNFNRLQFVVPYTLLLFNNEENKNIIPRYELFIKDLRKILLLSIKVNKKIVLEKIPYCIIGEKFSWGINSNLKLNQSSYENSKGYISNINEEEDSGMLKSIKCNGCKYNNICDGIPKEYYELYGDYFLIPIND